MDQLHTCNACGTKNSASRSFCLNCKGILEPSHFEEVSVIGRIKHFFGDLFCTDKVVILYEKAFFENAADSFPWQAHNLRAEQYKTTVQDLAPHGLIFVAEQTSIHRHDDDCAECLCISNYPVGMRERSVLPKPKVRNWKVSISSNSGTLFDADLTHGKALYESTQGKQILDRGFGYLGLGEMNEISYLIMFNKAQMLGLDNTAADRFAKLRGNVHAFFLSLLWGDQIAEFVEAR